MRRRDTPLHLTGVHAGASGWEKGQVENQVGLVRERFFTPRLRFKSYDEMSAWLLDKCIAYAKGHGAAALHLPRSRRRRERIVGQASPAPEFAASDADSHHSPAGGPDPRQVFADILRRRISG